jgi:hypothetical protein
MRDKIEKNNQSRKEFFKNIEIKRIRTKFGIQIK